MTGALGQTPFGQGAFGLGIPDQLAAVRAAMMAGQWDQAVSAAQQVIGTAQDPTVVVQAVGAQAQALAQLGRMAEALTSLESARARERAAGRLAAAGMLGVEEATIQIASGGVESAIPTLIDAAACFEAVGDVSSRVHAELQLAQAYQATSQLQPARQTLDACVAEARGSTDASLLAEVRNQDGVMHAAMGELDAAVTSLVDGVQAADRSGDASHRIQLRVTLAMAVGGHDSMRAASLLTEAENIAMTAIDTGVAAGGLTTIAGGWRAAGRIADCLRCGNAAVSKLRTAQAWPFVVNVEMQLADACQGAGRPDDARAYIDDALGIAHQLGGASAEATALFTLGQLAMARGDRPGARNALRAAADRLQAAQLPLPPPLSAALTQLAGLP